MSVFEKSKKTQKFVLSIFLIGLNLIISIYFFDEIKKANKQTFCYVLDDAYIHLSMAENLKHNNHWGIRNTDFTYSSSSPLWTAIISRFTSNFELIPLFLNIFFGSVLFVYLFFLIEYLLKSIYLSFIVTIFSAILIPIVPLYFTGLEHIFHILIILVVFHYFISFLEGKIIKHYEINFIYLMIATSLRLETFFLLIPIVLIYLKNKKYLFSFGTIVSSLLFIVVLGFESMQKGWYFLPNSVFLKSTISLDFQNQLYLFILQIPKSIYHSSYLIGIFLLQFLFLYNSIKNNNKGLNSINFTFFITLILHLQFARTNWFFRYDAYLIALFIIQSILNLKWLIGKYSNLFLTLLFVIGYIPLFARGIDSYSKVILTSTNIYSQPYLLSEFVKKYYDSSTIALNDIGSVSYKTNAKIIDLMGLANMDVARAIKNNKYNSAKIKEIAKNAEFIAVFENWFDNSKNLNQNMIKTAEWIINDNYILGNEKLTFYTLDSTRYNLLKKNLKDFIKEKKPFRLNFY